MSFNDDVVSVEHNTKARASQLWAELGHPTQELVRLNQGWFQNWRTVTSRNDQHCDVSTENSLVHPRISEIQNWIMNRLPRRPMEIGHPIIMDMNVHTYWHMFVEAAKRFSIDDPNSCALVTELLFLQRITLKNKFDNEPELVISYTSTGEKIWSDLAFLLSDLMSALQADMTTEHRANLSGFVARLASCDVLEDSLFGLFLVLARDALESRRPLFREENGTEVSIKELLPALTSWMRLTRYRIEELVQNSADEFDSAISAPGPLVSADCQGGFSITRWKFWGERLETLRGTGDQDISDCAEAILDWWNMIDSQTLGGADPEGSLKTTSEKYWVAGSSA